MRPQKRLKIGTLSDGTLDLQFKGKEVSLEINSHVVS